MSNHVTSKIVVTGDKEQLKAFKELMFKTLSNEQDGEWLQFDFNQIIPMPEILKNSRASLDPEEAAKLIILKAIKGSPYCDGGLGAHYFRDLRLRYKIPEETSFYEIADRHLKENPALEAEGLAALERIHQTGYISWYPWSCKHWGTKWNSYEACISEESEVALEFFFQTAWVFPIPVFEAIAKKFDKLKFNCLAYAEGPSVYKGVFNPTEEHEEPLKQYKAEFIIREIYKAVFDEEYPTYDDEE